MWQWLEAMSKQALATWGPGQSWETGHCQWSWVVQLTPVLSVVLRLLVVGAKRLDIEFCPSSKAFHSLMFTDTMVSDSLSSWPLPSPEKPPHLIPAGQSSPNQFPVSHWTVPCLPFFFAGRICGLSLSSIPECLMLGWINSRSLQSGFFFLSPQNYINPNTLFFFFFFFTLQMTKLDQVHGFIEENPKWAAEQVMNSPSYWMPLM